MNLVPRIWMMIKYVSYVVLQIRTSEFRTSLSILLFRHIFQEDDDVQLTRFHSQRDVVWNTVCKYISHLSNEEINETRQQFCGCVNSIINAYEEKLREVQALKNRLIVWKQKSHGQGKKIEKLEREVIDLTKQLASKVCEECGEKKITEQLGSLSMQENKVTTNILEN